MSDIINACSILNLSFESGMPYAPRHAMLGIDPDAAREAAVAARTEYDQLRAELDQARKRIRELEGIKPLLDSEALESERAAHQQTREELAAWRKALGEFGRQTPDEVVRARITGWLDLGNLYERIKKLCAEPTGESEPVINTK